MSTAMGGPRTRPAQSDPLMFSPRLSFRTFALYYLCVCAVDTVLVHQHLTLLHLYHVVSAATRLSWVNETTSHNNCHLTDNTIVRCQQ